MSNKLDRRITALEAIKPPHLGYRSFTDVPGQPDMWQENGRTYTEPEVEDLARAGWAVTRISYRDRFKDDPDAIRLRWPDVIEPVKYGDGTLEEE